MEKGKVNKSSRREQQTNRLVLRCFSGADFRDIALELVSINVSSYISTTIANLDEDSHRKGRSQKEKQARHERVGLLLLPLPLPPPSVASPA